MIVGGSSNAITYGRPNGGKPCPAVRAGERGAGSKRRRVCGSRARSQCPCIRDHPRQFSAGKPQEANSAFSTNRQGPHLLVTGSEDVLRSLLALTCNLGGSSLSFRLHPRMSSGLRMLARCRNMYLFKKWRHQFLPSTVELFLSQAFKCGDEAIILLKAGEKQTTLFYQVRIVTSAVSAKRVSRVAPHSLVILHVHLKYVPFDLQQ